MNLSLSESEHEKPFSDANHIDNPAGYRWFFELFHRPSACQSPNPDPNANHDPAGNLYPDLDGHIHAHSDEHAYIFAYAHGDRYTVTDRYASSDRYAPPAYPDTTHRYARTAGDGYPGVAPRDSQA